MPHDGSDTDQRGAASPPLQKYIGAVGPVKSASAFDEKRLATYLAHAVQGFRGPLSVRQFEGGQSNPTYLLITPDAKYVLRRKPPGVLLPSAHAVDREYRITRALFDQGFPAPEPLCLCTDEDVIGTMFYVMRHVEGRVFWDCRMPDLTPAERGAVYDSANEALARLHTVDFEAAGLGDFGRPGNYFARQIARWSRQYEASRTETIGEMDKLMEWLMMAAPADDGANCIVHGDYSFHNLLVHPREPRVSAVIDWELSTIGHPLGDLMYHAMEWYRPAGIDARGTLRGADLKALGVPSLEDYILRYRERTGLVIVGPLGFYRAFNLFRVAAILQGIAGRMRDGLPTAANAADVVARIRPIAEAAWREAKEAGAT
jgi:aminoglycoside phosphotransferase (APT) family kinase protein